MLKSRKAAARVRGSATAEWGHAPLARWLDLVRCLRHVTMDRSRSQESAISVVREHSRAVEDRWVGTGKGRTTGVCRAQDNDDRAFRGVIHAPVGRIDGRSLLAPGSLSPSAFPSKSTVASSRVSPRLQWRARVGFSPTSITAVVELGEQTTCDGNRQCTDHMMPVTAKRPSLAMAFLATVIVVRERRGQSGIASSVSSGWSTMACSRSR